MDLTSLGRPIQNFKARPHDDGRLHRPIKLQFGAVAAARAYLPKTDGHRNICCERLFLTMSPRVEEVLPQHS